ncbi:protein NATD1 isoform X7 [Drosophila virilis]|uniref:Protein NATD1 n=1 Tax=Drosophila virilis TaxID=7244 RepID=A0A0Q9WKJ3_DROVI|nr:uncharacterized protein LOC26531925 [Drosophila virilis]KRF80928.1 uncharacterized protein Dvir_GJ27155, isoform B [Drosophila virilis]
MFSVSRVMCSSLKNICIISLPKANRVVYSQLQLPLRTQNFTTLKKPETFQISRLRTHCRCMGTIIKIVHEENRFFIEMNDEVAELKYSINDGVMEIKQTKVPKKLGGHGLGKLLAKVALEYAVQHDLILKISCSFVQFYIEQYEPRYLKYILY